ncbi:MAG: UDP-N-acetylmuramoyl-L-alanine--D-glutamate ligase, partial [Burkholderiales bacterium]
LQALRDALPGAAFRAAALEPSLVDGVDLVAWSPGISPLLGEAQALYQACAERGVEVAGELELFARELHRLAEERAYRPRCVAITGTNGKTTTARLLAHLAQFAGTHVELAGNVSPPVLDRLRDCLQRDALPELWVLELSSFQLALASSFAPDAATILNVSEDHLDWHGSMEQYLAAKQRVYGPDTICVYNRSDPATRPPAGRRAIGFGLDAPAAAGDFGLVHEAGMPWFAELVAVDEPGRRRREPRSVQLRRLMPADAMRIRGAHNHANALAALALGRAIGLPLAKLLFALRGFDGDPHRCELVAVVRDVEYYDDSKGTNVGATVAALSGLGKRAVLIAGGDGKGQDFGPLAAAVAVHARAVMLIGRDAPRLRAALAGAGVPLTDCASLGEAVREAARVARLGEAVLLSPACASLDSFRNYAHRGQVFQDAVRELAAEAGQPC